MTWNDAVIRAAAGAPAVTTLRAALGPRPSGPRPWSAETKQNQLADGGFSGVAKTKVVFASRNGTPK